MFGLGKAKTNFKFEVGDTVEYTGSVKKMKGEYTIQKRHHEKGVIHYTCKDSKGKNHDIAQAVLDDAGYDNDGLGKLKAKYTIQDVDKLARKIQHGSGVKMQKTITHYNISHKEAKKKAFDQIKKMTQSGMRVRIK
jgi:hypothetical protein